MDSLPRFGLFDHEQNLDLVLCFCLLTRAVPSAIEAMAFVAFH